MFRMNVSFRCWQSLVTMWRIEWRLAGDRMIAVVFDQLFRQAWVLSALEYPSTLTPPLPLESVYKAAAQASLSSVVYRKSLNAYRN